MKKNVFVPALTDLQREELETVHGIGDVAFHGLLEVERLVDQPETLDFDTVLADARRELKAFDGSIDGIIAHWDFPTSVLVPMLCKDYGIPSPSLESVLKCEHKYWSRVEQEKSVPEFIPRFSSFDPFDDDALSKIELEFPFWVKPVKAFASQLGFMIENEEQFRAAMKETREKIGQFGDPFEQAMAHADVPAEITALGGSACIAEEIIAGIQSAPEGTVFNGKFNVHGTLDMLPDDVGKSFGRLVYPSTLPEKVQERMHNCCERFLKHIGFDDGCFNAEFMWDEARDKLWLIEVNTRISQSHSEMFIKVDGESNHRVAIDVALGIRPDMPRGKGRFKVAAKCQINYYGQDAIAKRVPTEAELSALERRFPRSAFVIELEEGMRLSDLPNQNTRAFHLGDIYIGAQSHEELVQNFNNCMASLSFDLEPVKHED